MSRPPINPPTSALEILRTLHSAGKEAYLVGGCVRDWLMGRVPKDWDITTNATPDEIEILFSRTIPVGKSFGVMIVVIDGHEHEIATFRCDGGYQDGRRPDYVKFTNAEEDVKRRDFTINALLYDPINERLIDYVGGEKDIATETLRTVGDPEQRFREDHLRLLRAVRFAARTGFAIDDATMNAIGELAGLVRTVSAERVGEELSRMVGEGYACSAFTQLEASGLLIHVLPELAPMKGMPQPPEFHPEGDVWEHTLLMLKLLDETPVSCRPLTQEEIRTLGWAALLHDVAKPLTLTVSDRIRFHEHDTLGAEMAVEILQRLNRPNRLIDAVRDLIGRHIHFAAIEKMRTAKRRRFLQEPLFPLHLALHRLDCESSHRMSGPYEFALAAWQEEDATPPTPEPLLTGRDLISMGYPPGPRMGEILHALEDARLEGEVDSTDQAREWVERHFPEK